MPAYEYRPTVDQVMDALWQAAIYWKATGHVHVSAAVVSLADGETDLQPVAEAA